MNLINGLIFLMNIFSIESLSVLSKNTLDNINYVNTHNLKDNKNFELDINKFIYRKYENEFHNSSNMININNIKNTENLSIIVKDELDWRNHGAVTSVKNQGNCGSCWAFSSSEAIEGVVYLNTKNLYNLSEQELVDCSYSYGNNGCGGGSMDSAFEYVIDNGLCDNNSYPYISNNINNACNNDTCNKVAYIKNFSDVNRNSEYDLKKALNKNPISVAIQANKRSFQLYKKGIYDDIDCGYQLDHGVLLVGYGKEMELDYWIVKNSWGEDWGENGYIRLKRNIMDDRGICGIAMMPSYPIY